MVKTSEVGDNPEFCDLLFKLRDDLARHHKMTRFPTSEIFNEYSNELTSAFHDSLCNQSRELLGQVEKLIALMRPVD